MTEPTRARRVPAVIAGAAGVLALAGCAPVSGQASAPPTHLDGVYTADGSYATPQSVEQITVTVTLEDDLITNVSVVGSPQKPETVQYQSRFIGGISDAVVGRDIDAISVSHVAGSSLTSGGFNEAIAKIRSESVR